MSDHQTGDPSPETEAYRSERASLSHLDESGEARMVDVSGKLVTTRHAAARGRVRVSADVVRLLRGEGDLPKGDALGVAKIAGIMAAKQTSQLIPLCHPLALSHVDVELDVVGGAVEIMSTVTTTDRTGAEMEALTAVSVAALTVIDMVKAVDKHAVIDGVRVIGKSGGKSGAWGIYSEHGDVEDRRPGAAEPGHPPLGQGPGA
jgi:cyclic pyranopterin phosphate synthase